VCTYATYVELERKELFFIYINSVRIHVCRCSLLMKKENMKVKKNQLNCALADHQSACDNGGGESLWRRGVCCVILRSFPNSLRVRSGELRSSLSLSLSEKTLLLQLLYTRVCVCYNNNNNNNVYLAYSAAAGQGCRRSPLFCILYNSRFGRLCRGHGANFVRGAIYMRVYNNI